MKKWANNNTEKNCLWYNTEHCGDCKGTVNDFKYRCKHDEMFIEMAYQCPKCKTGIINPTYYKTLICDKCNFDMPAHEVAKIYPNIKNYL